MDDEGDAPAIQQSVDVTASVESILQKHSQSIMGDAKSAFTESLNEGLQALGETLATKLLQHAATVPPTMARLNTVDAVDVGRHSQTVMDHNVAFSADPNSVHNLTDVGGQRYAGKFFPRRQVRSPSRDSRRSRGRSRDRSRDRSCHSGIRHRSRDKSRDRSRSRRRYRSRSHHRSRSSSSSKGYSSVVSATTTSRGCFDPQQQLNSGSQKGATTPNDDDALSITAPNPDTLEGNQNRWTNKVQCYNTEEKWGPEVDSAIAGASKLFWQSNLPENRIAELEESALIPSNCTFLRVRKVNSEIFTATAPNIRTGDVALQEIQKIQVSLTSCLVQAAGILEGNPDAWKAAQDKISDALQLSGHMSNAIEQHRREAFKISLPDEKKMLVSMPVPPESEFLFGDDLDTCIEEIKKKNKLKKEFAKPAFTPKKSNTTNKARTSATKSNEAGNEKSRQKGPADSSSGGKKYNNNYNKDKYKKENTYSNKENKRKSSTSKARKTDRRR